MVEIKQLLMVFLSYTTSGTSHGIITAIKFFWAEILLDLFLDTFDVNALLSVGGGFEAVTILVLGLLLAWWLTSCWKSSRGVPSSWFTSSSLFEALWWQRSQVGSSRSPTEIHNVWTISPQTLHLCSLRNCRCLLWQLSPRLHGSDDC